jgi:hypothetical protein
MGYYGMGDYYRGQARGDYYRMRGDPGIFGLLAGTVLKYGARLLTKVVKPAVAMGTGGIIAGGIPKITQALQGPVTVNPGAILPGGKPFIEFGGGGSGKRRRMNPANAKALRRAIRREQAFIKLARRSLKGTGITIGRTASFARKKKGR